MASNGLTRRGALGAGAGVFAAGTLASPAVSGSQNKPALCRFDLLQQHAGLDVRAMWPAENRQGPGADTWNWDTFPRAAEACHRAGFPFGLPMGSFTDAVEWVGALFASFNARFIDEQGAVTVRRDPGVRAGLEYLVGLARFLPNDVWARDDAPNNRALISGREQAAAQVETTVGCDIPPFASMTDFPTWETVGPPRGVVFNHPQKPHHNSRTSVAFAPAPAEIAVQACNQAINTKLVARVAQGGESIDQARTWAERELRSFARG